MDSIDFGRLTRDGFVTLQAIVRPDELAEFERVIETFSNRQAAILGLKSENAEIFIDLFRIGGKYTNRLYALLERVEILNLISARIGRELTASGFMKQAGIEVPLVWPDIRADIPDDAERVLPVHQDFGSTKCERAWRLWIPLRASNAQTGSMLLYPGTHLQGVVPHTCDDPLKPTVEPSHYRNIEPVVFDLPAGDGVLMSPLVLHASVPNRGKRTKFTMLIQVQDYATMIHPGDSSGMLAGFELIEATRAKARARVAG